MVDKIRITPAKGRRMLNWAGKKSTDKTNSPTGKLPLSSEQYLYLADHIVNQGQS